MNISSLFRTAYQTIGFITPRIMSMKPSTNFINHMCKRQYLHSLSSTCTNKLLLQPSIPMYNSTCGLKMKTMLHRRCKHCVMVWKNDRRYILCKASPRHNQVERKPAPYKTWILTFAQQKREREW